MARDEEKGGMEKRKARGTRRNNEQTDFFTSKMTN